MPGAPSAGGKIGWSPIAPKKKAAETCLPRFLFAYIRHGRPSPGKEMPSDFFSGRNQPGLKQGVIDTLLIVIQGDIGKLFF